MKQRHVFINLIFIIMLVSGALGVSLVGLAGLAQAAPAPLALAEKAELALPPALPPTSTTLIPSSVAENQVTGTLVGTFTTEDPDTDQSYTYTFTNTASFPDNAFFSITGDTLNTAASFNFEATNSYNVSVLTTDSGDESIVTNFTINITDVNEAPTDINLSNNTIAENAAISTTIGTLSVVDPDTSGSYTYTLVSGTGSTDNGSFVIVGSTLKNNAIFNFEVKDSYSIRVRVTDNGGLFFEKQFTINVTDVNEAPTGINLSNSTIAENQSSGTTVGIFTPVDPDATGSYTFTLVSGAGSTDNGSFNILSGNTLVTTASFNFEVKDSYSIRVRVTDNGGLFFEKQFTINVTDVNENPTDINLSNNIIAENQPSGTTVGTFTPVDPDTTGSYTYTLVNPGSFPDNNSFTISGNTLRTAAVFDFIIKSSYTIRVRVTDNGGLPFTKTFTINVTDVLPIISMTKTANPTSVPETGANVTFTIRITTSQENARLVSLSDSTFDLNTRCPNWPNYFINAGQSYTCTFTAFISGDYPANHQNIATATIKDNENNSDPDVGTATVTFTDVLPNLSVAYTPNPANVNEPGGNVTFSVLITNLSTETGTLTLLQDSTFGNLSGQGSCATGGTLAASGGTYSCSFTKLVSGTFGQTRLFTATARLTDNDTNFKNVTDNASVFIGEMPKVYLPIITKPAPTDLSVFNKNTGGNITFTVIGTGVSCTVPNNVTLFCGSFPPGTYTVQVTAKCGSATETKTYASGPQTTTISCN